MINSFSKYLIEEEKVIFFTFGRMNPPTIGHEKLLDKLASLSKSSMYRVYLSQTQDNKKNPLQYSNKIKIARKMFPRHARSIMSNKKVKTVFDALTALYDEGYVNITMVVGSDRVNEFDILINRYNGKKGKHGFYNFRKINVISAGQRDPDAEGAEGASATKQREAAKSNDFTSFAQGLPKRVSNSDARKIFNSIRKGLGLKEQKEFKNHLQLNPISELRESYVDGKLFKEGDQVVIKDTGELGTIQRLGSNYVIVEGTGNTYRKWLDAIERVDEKKPEYETASFSQSVSEQTEIFTIVEQKNPEDLDIGDRKGSQPVNYHKGLKKSTKIKRDAQFKKQAKMSDDNPKAYKPAPGDANAKTKPSVHTKRFKQMFGENEMQTMAKKRIEREKQADKIKHDRMMDRARMRDTQKKNKETK
jgi:hypothetical protein